jgi:transcriptional regulator with XRE-family HTH domain
MGRRHEPQPALGRVVRQLRKERGLKQYELAKAADVDPSVISHLELGHSNPTWGSIKRVANGLGVAVADLAAQAAVIERKEEAARRRRARREKRASAPAKGGSAPAKRGSAPAKRASAPAKGAATRTNRASDAAQTDRAD